MAQATGSFAHFDWMNADKVFTDQRPILGLPSDYERSQEEVDQLRQERQQQQEQQAKLQQAEQLAKTANQGAGAVKQIHEVGMSGLPGRAA
jgi:hypothetical protein